MISNLCLFARAIGAVLLMTGIGPGIAFAILFEQFGVGAVRPQQSESGQVRGSNPRFVSDYLSANSTISGGGQLATHAGLIPVLSNGATSPPRKVRRSA